MITTAPSGVTATSTGTAAPPGATATSTPGGRLRLDDLAGFAFPIAGACLLIVAGAVLEQGPGLTDIELYLFFNLLFSAGAETTRNAIAGGLLALARHPDQYARLRDDPALLPSAIEEVLRWTTPSPSKRRTATSDTELGGCAIEAGQKVLVWEASANRDAQVFDAPDVFDVGRKPNPHLGFGQGIHYCLGANLARLELRVLFEEILARYTAIDVTAPVEWTRSNRHTGIRHLWVALS